MFLQKFLNVSLLNQDFLVSQSTASLVKVGISTKGLDRIGTQEVKGNSINSTSNPSENQIKVESSVRSRDEFCKY